MGAVVYAQSSLNFPVDDKPRYFPVGVFSGDKANDDFRDRWYANQLRALKEPSLSTNASAGAETIYRFTWLRSFHHPVAVRITVHANGTGTLTSKMADGAGGYGPGKLIANSTRDVGPNEVQRVLALIDATGFWKMPAENETGGLDGAQWIFEGNRHGSYHVIDRWSPQEGPLRDLGLYLALTLSKLDVRSKEIY
jgi:hypothetical protein